MTVVRHIRREDREGLERYGWMTSKTGHDCCEAHYKGRQGRSRKVWLDDIKDRA